MSTKVIIIFVEYCFMQVQCTEVFLSFFFSIGVLSDSNREFIQTFFFHRHKPIVSTTFGVSNEGIALHYYSNFASEKTFNSREPEC